jgi:sporulation protein YlmC with PRC-barrel domain
MPGRTKVRSAMPMTSVSAVTRLQLRPVLALDRDEAPVLDRLCHHAADAFFDGPNGLRPFAPKLAINRIRRPVQMLGTHRVFGTTTEGVAGTIGRMDSYFSRSPREDETMPTPSGHTTAILASKVRGTPVYNGEGDKIGTVEDVVLDKMSNNIMFAVLGSGGVLGMGEKFRPIPWSILDYNSDKGGYVVPVSKDTLQNAPAYRMEDLTSDDGEEAIRAEAYSYYHAEQYW